MSVSLCKKLNFCLKADVCDLSVWQLDCLTPKNAWIFDYSLACEHLSRLSPATLNSCLPAWARKSITTQSHQVTGKLGCKEQPLLMVLFLRVINTFRNHPSNVRNKILQSVWQCICYMAPFKSLPNFLSFKPKSLTFYITFYCRYQWTFKVKSSVPLW